MLFWRYGVIRALLLVLPVLFAAASAAATEAVQIDAATQHLSLAPYTTYHQDLSGNDDLAAATKRLGEGVFQPLPGGNASFGFQDGAYWFHATLHNRGMSKTSGCWCRSTR